jgi:UDP-N-acetylmuramyl pentapeptide phosphotransferase/UDP-N-acetylglucosamine-1-phosphate transferase
MMLGLLSEISKRFLLAWFIVSTVGFIIWFDDYVQLYAQRLVMESIVLAILTSLCALISLTLSSAIVHIFKIKITHLYSREIKITLDLGFAVLIFVLLFTYFRHISSIT